MCFLSSQAQEVEWVRSFSMDVTNLCLGSYWGDSTISSYAISLNQTDSIRNLDSRGNVLRGKKVDKYLGGGYPYDWLYMQQGPGNSLYSRHSSAYYNRNLDTIRFVPLNNNTILSGFRKDGSRVESNLRSLRNQSLKNVTYYIKRYDKYNTLIYNISLVSKNNGFSSGIYSYDENGNFYYSSKVYPIDTLVIGGQSFPLSYSNGISSILSLDSLGNVRYVVPGGPNAYTLYGNMKVGKDKNLYVNNDQTGYIQKISPKGTVLWSKSSFGNGWLDVDDSCNVFVFGRRGAQDGFMKLDSSGKVVFQKNLLGRMNNAGPYSILSFPKTNEFYISGGSGVGLDCYTMTSGFIAKLYTGTVPSLAKLTLTGINLASNIQTGNYWYRNDTLLVNETKPTIWLLRDGLYKLKAYCRKDSILFKGISVNTITGLLTTISINGASYQWFLNSVSLPGATLASHMPAANGTYTVRVTFDPTSLPNGRTESNHSLTAVYKQQVSGVVTAIDDEEVEFFEIFPNPTNNEYNIQWVGTKNATMEVYDNLGRLVAIQPLTETISKFQTHALWKGVFTIKIGNRVKSLVVQ